MQKSLPQGRITRKVYLIGALLLAATAIGWQKEPIPPAVDDPAHPNAPMWCQREDDGHFMANCECHMECEKGEAVPPEITDEEGVSLCRSYCRKGACKCSKKCDS